MFNPDQMLVTLLQASVEAGASDLHLSVGRPPTARRDGTLVPFEGVSLLTPHDTERMVFSLLQEFQREILDEVQQVDFSFGLDGLGRFRANAYKQRNTYALALRVVPFRVRSLEELGAPPAATDLLTRPYGLVLVVGPTGSGKTTTLAAMIDRINATRPVHILTIEDPVEYLHQHKMAMVNQREVGTDVLSFTDGLRSALREDPDVILLGEMRDLDSIAITLTLAETGHLVFGTLHTNDAAQALDRIVDVFPPERRDQIQIMLAGSLQGVISQRLLPALALANEVAYGFGAHQHFVGGDSSATLDGDESLADHALQGAGELDLDLVTSFGGEDVDDAIECLRGIIRVQRREHQVASLSERQRDRDAVEVAHFAQEHNVRVLTQSAPQTVGEAEHVGAHLALVDHRSLVIVHVLDRVLDREDVARPLLVDSVDHRGEGGALSRAGRAHHKHQSIWLVEQIDAGPRRAQLLE